MLPPDRALVERFTRDWQALTRERCGDRAIVAVSGGPDSSALLILMAAIQRSTGPSLAATVDHGLRAAASVEADRAADVARALGIEHRILHGPLPDRSGDTANISARARSLRYALLEALADEVGAGWIVTAHHADDQLETMVMRLNRGSGIRGLAGVRPLAGRVVRPLLGWRRHELATIVDAAGITAVTDPSNVDDRFDRARLRKKLAPVDWLDARMAARSAAALEQANDAIGWAVGIAEESHCRYGVDQATLTPHLLPEEIKRRLVERCLRRVDPAIEPRGSDVTRLIARLEDRTAGTLGRVACHVAPCPDTQLPLWVFRPAPPHVR